MNSKKSKSYQINVKLPEKLYEETQNYFKEKGYSNTQELIREAIREKVMSQEVKDDYINSLFQEDAIQDIGKEKSEQLLEKMKRRNDKNGFKR